MASASSSASPQSQKKYDVFVSFRGEDTRTGIASHLRVALRDKEIDTYMDDKIEKGDGLWPTLREAIENSSLYIVILSENYASSTWCLRELTEILKCTEDHAKGPRVIPLFYKVQPADVRKQLGSYKKAFVEHERNKDISKQEVQKWRTDLTFTSKLAGWDSSSSDIRDEAELVKKIVKDVILKLDKMFPSKSPDLTKYVGIPQKMRSVELLLNKGSPQEVRFIGIWGMVGIGKTTLARAIYDKLCPKYERRCFLENVREESTKINGISSLKKNLVSTLLGDKDMSSEISEHQDKRLARTKVLAVLDDVNTVEQIENLAEGHHCFGAGSRILITARDLHVLSQKVDDVYTVQALNHKEASLLFYRNAFKVDYLDVVNEKFRELAENMIDFAVGNPLALTVLGRSLWPVKSQQVWKWKLDKLKKMFYQHIHNVLKLSFEKELNAEEDKNIFLDTACFFVGKNVVDVQDLLDGYDYSSSIVIKSLQDKALINVSQGKIFMHDLIQEMGRQIVRKESTDPENRSRLWDTGEIFDILSENKGTKTIEGITLNLSEIEDVELRPQVFSSMPILRILDFDYTNKNEQIIESVKSITSKVSEIVETQQRPQHLYTQRDLEYYASHNEKVDRLRCSHGLESLSNKLRLLRWERYPLTSLPLAFSSKHLVILEMQNNNLTKLWDGDQNLVNLKKIDLSFSKHLIELPNFSKAINLEEVNLSNCSKLESLHSSILTLPSLTHLIVKCCDALHSLTSDGHLKSLVHLDLSGCSSLRKLSVASESKLTLHLKRTIFDNIEFSSSSGHPSKIDTLDLSKCNSVTNLPSQLVDLSYLRYLHICGCKNLQLDLRSMFDQLRALERLLLDDCNGLSELPDNISLLSSLSELSLARTDVETLPVSIKQLSILKSLRLNGCKMLQYLPELPPSIFELYASNCTSTAVTVVEKEEEELEEGEEQEEEEELFSTFNFSNCMKLDEQSIKVVEAKALVEMNQAILLAKKNKKMNKAIYSKVKLIYPGNKVPDWFMYRSTKSSITVNVFSTPQHLDHSFIVCAVLSELSCKKPNDFPEVAIIKIRWVLNGERVNTSMSHHFHIEEPFESDHVCLWHVSLPPRVQRIIKTMVADGQSSTNRPSLDIIFNLVIYPPHSDDDDDDDKASAVSAETIDMIKECGVCPTYAPTYQNYINIKRVGLTLQPKDLIFPAPPTGVRKNQTQGFKDIFTP